MQKSDKQEEINMKRYYPLVFALICILFLSGCQTSPMPSQDIEPATSEITNIPEYLLNENGTHYLILPISKEKIWIWDEQIIPYLDDIDFTLLKAAEEKISRDVSQHSDQASFYLQLDDGHLWLSAEVIVDIAAPANGDEGCGIDHEHLFFGEQITQ